MHVKRIARGANYLDRHEDDWWDQTNPHRLDPGSNEECVIGQVYGDFNWFLGRRFFLPTSMAKKHLLTRPWWPIAYAWCTFHGFDTIRETDSEWKAAWVDEITARRAAKMPVKNGDAITVV